MMNPKFVPAIAVLSTITIFFAITNVIFALGIPPKQNIPEEDMINIFNKGKKISLTSKSEDYKKLIVEIEKIVTESNDSYRLMPSESRLNELKQKGTAVEAIYFLPKDIHIAFFEKTIRVSKIIIPLSKSSLPLDAVFVFEADKDFPHSLLNRNKNSLDKLIMQY